MKIIMKSKPLRVNIWWIKPKGQRRRRFQKRSNLPFQENSYERLYGGSWISWKATDRIEKTRRIWSTNDDWFSSRKGTERSCHLWKEKMQNSENFNKEKLMHNQFVIATNIYDSKRERSRKKTRRSSHWSKNICLTTKWCFSSGTKRSWINKTPKMININNNLIEQELIIN